VSFGRKSLRRVVVNACDGPFGSGLKSEHYVDEGARVIRLGNLGSGDWLNSDAAFIDLAYWAMLRRHHAAAGDLIMAGLGDEAHSVGRACVLPDVGPALVKADCYRLRLDPLKADARFMALYLSSTAGGSEAQMLAEGSTRSRLTLSKGLSIQVPDIDVDTQRAIADYLDAETARIDAMIEKLRERRRLLAERFRACLLGDLAENWHLRPLRRAASRVKTGGTPPEVRGGDCSWYTPASFLDRLALGEPVRFVPCAWLADGTAPRFGANSTLVVGIGATAGRVAHLDSVASGNQQITCIEADAAASSRFVSWQLWARSDELRGIAPTTTLPIISNELLKSLPFVCPPLDEQHRMTERWDRMAGLSEEVDSGTSRLVDRLLERRQALITAAVTGQIEIPGVAA
jgi:type I restriction enzyme, S subunit